MAEEKNTQFNYLLNAMEHAASEAHPAKAGYAGKRKALMAHVRELERKAALCDALVAAKQCRDAAIKRMEANDDGEFERADAALDEAWAAATSGVAPTGEAEKRLRAWWNAAPHDMAESDFAALLVAAGVAEVRHKTEAPADADAAGIGHE